MPIGPNNRIEPGGPDLGQPTHFLPGRQIGMFTVTVPEGVHAGSAAHVDDHRQRPDDQHPAPDERRLQRQPVQDSAHGAVTNTPPVIRLEEKASPIQGPIATASRPVLTRTTALSSPLVLDVWADDDAKYSSGTGTAPRNPPPPVTVTWTKYRGPGKVTFDKAKPEMEKLAGGNIGEPFRGKVLDHGEVQRAGRVHAARDRERLFGRRRRRRGVLLDDRDGEGDGYAMLTKVRRGSEDTARKLDEEPGFDYSALIQSHAQLSTIGILAASSWPRLFATPAAAQVTFTRDVAPILHAKCVSCHRPGEAAPMPLRTFAEARPFARAIKERVVARKMPPWPADRAIGAFTNDPSLTDREIATIVEWVDSGAAQGDPAHMPAVPQFTEGLATRRARPCRRPSGNSGTGDRRAICSRCRASP